LLAPGLGRDLMVRDARNGRPACLAHPQVSLLGEVDETMFDRFQSQLAEAANGDDDIAIEITTPGGDAEYARRMVLEVELARKRLNQRLVFLGKTEVYSAGVTLMSAFPRGDRYLTRDAVLLIHSRQHEETLEISGPMRLSLPRLEAAKAQVELGIRLEEENFRRLIEGSDVRLDEVIEKALHNWYVPAKEALERGLVAALVDPV
jgi:ATP-dependent protease ClpP protease subunit